MALTNLKKKLHFLQSGGDSAGSRSYRLAAVGLVLLCVLLLTAITLLCFKFTAERDQLQTSNSNLTAERDQLQTCKTNLTAERDQLQTSYTILTAEKDQLQTSYTHLTIKKDQLQKNRDDLQKILSDLSDSAAERIRELEARVRELESQLQDMSATTLQINRYCSTDEEFRFYTRFTSEKVFLIFWDSITPSASRLVYWSKAQRVEDVMEIEKPSPNRRLALVDEFFMYCCRVAVGLKEKVLADIFGVSTATVSRVIITWANYLYLVLGSMPIWMSREQVQATMPEKFTRYCSNVRVILDCTEVRCETPSSLTLQSETFSAYKNHTTFKALIGVAPCGVITFVSKLFTGSISDQEITRQSGFLTLLEPGDACMADKGFIIDQMLSEVGASLIIPPFKRGTCFSKEETEKTQAIARLRILVERAIRRVKEYHIWDTTIPLTLSGSVNQLWTNCCLMTNYQGPLDVKSNLPV